MAFITKRNGSYILRDKAEKRWIKLGKISFIEANQVLLKYKTDKTYLRLGLPLPPVKMTFKELSDEYLDDAKTQKAETTLKKEKDLIKILNHSLGGLRLHEITTQGLEGLLRSYGLAPASFHDRAKVLKNVFKYAVENRYIPGNPCTNIRVPAIQDLPPRAIDPSLIEKVFKQMKGPILAYFKILYYTGLRPGEALRLKADDIDFKNSRIFVLKTKTNKFRTVPIHKKLKPFLKDLVAARIGYLFPSDDGHQKSMVMGLRRAVKNAGLKGRGISQYAYRHSFATHILDKTANLGAVQKLLGHSRITMTERYAHVLDKRLKEAVGTL